MKKIIYLLCILAALSATGCVKKESKNPEVSEVIERMKSVAKIKEAEDEKLTDTKSAERYGIASTIIESGVAVSSRDKNTADKIILLKAKTDDDVLDLERAMQDEIRGMSLTWEKTDNDQYKKVKEHVVKTRGRYIVLIVSDNPDELEKIFDTMV